MKCSVIAAALIILATSVANAEGFTTADVERAQRVALASHSSLDSQLKDYPIARFRNTVAHYHVRLDDHSKMFFLCGEVDAKNGLGVYNGWLPFLVLEGGKVQLPDENTPESAYRIFCA